MKPFFISLGLCLGMVAAITFWADVDHRWHRIPVMPTRGLTTGEVWVWPAINWDERTFKISQLALQKTPDVIVLGNSHAAMISTDMFPHQTTLFNMSISGASLEDLLIMWQVVKVSNRIPKRIVLEIDPWMLTADITQFQGWRKYSNYLNDFLHFSQQSGIVRPIKLWTTKCRNLFTEMTELFSWIEFKSVLKYIYGLRKGFSSKFVGIILERNLPGTEQAFHADGSRVYSTLDSSPKDRRALENIISKKTLGDDLFYLTPTWSFSPGDDYRLGLLLHEMAIYHVNVLIILPPLHSLEYNELIQRREYKHIFPEFVTHIQRLNKSYPNVHICNTGNSAWNGCQDIEFYDGSHMRAPCAAKVVNYCFSKIIHL